MSTGIVFNGSSYTVPAIGDASWGTSVSNYLIAIASGCLQKTGGTFTLGAEVDFGATAGLKALYLKSESSNAASSGVVQLSSSDSISWRDNANSSDLLLTINASNALKFNGADLADTASAQTFTNKLFSDTTCKFISSLDSTKALMVSLAGASSPSTMTLISSQSADRTLTLPDVTDTLVGLDASQTLTNKTIGNTNVVTTKVSNFTLQDGTDATKQFKFIASSISTGTTRSLTVPNTSDTLAVLTLAQTLSNKTLDNTNTATLKASNLTLQDATDTTKQFKFIASSITTGTTRSLTVPDTTDTLAVLSLAQTFTNKTIGNTNVITAKASNFTLQDATDTTKQFNFVASGITTGNTRSLTVPNTSDTLAVLSLSQTLANKTFDNTNIYTTKASNFTLQDGTDTTKQFGFNAASISPSSFRSITIPDVSGTLVLLNSQQTITSKILSDGTVFIGNSADSTKTLGYSLGGATTGTKMTFASSHTANRTLTFPDINDTVVTLASVQTLTNKTLTAPSITAGSFVNFLGQSAARLNDASTNYIGLQAPASVTTYSITLPAAVPASGQVLADAGAGNGVMTWVSPASSTLVATGVDIGNGSNTRTATRTDLLGDISATTNSQAYTVTSASPGVFTVTAHGFLTGDKVYLTATQNGFTANQTYWVNKTGANTFTLCSSLANAVAGTGLTSSGTTAGTVNSGGFVLTSGVKGVTGSGNATTGYVGEYVQSTFTTVSTAATAVTSNYGSLTLAPGAWTITGSANFRGSSSTNFIGGQSSLNILTVSGGAGGTEGINLVYGQAPAITTNNGILNLSIPMMRVNISASTTYYINGSTQFTGTTPTVSGAMMATRAY